MIKLMSKAKLSGAKIFAFLIIVGLIGIAYIWNSYIVDKKANEIIKLEKRLEELKIERLFLESRYEKLISANYIVPFAQKNLGLVFPKENPKEIYIGK